MDFKQSCLKKSLDKHAAGVFDWKWVYSDLNCF